MLRFFPFFQPIAARLCASLLFSFLIPVVRGEALADLSAAVSNDWNSAGKALTAGDWELWLSGYSYHAPWSYARQHCEDLNSNAWGLGVARSVVDAKGDKHTVYILGFDDSYYHGEFHLGYMWMRSWRWKDQWPSFGLGYSVFLFSRRDMYNHAPVPGLLPFAAIGGRRLKLYATYVPKVQGFVQGNTAYLFVAVKL